MEQTVIGNEIRLRPMGEEDIGFLYHLYASTRADEMALLDWDESQKTAFLRMQFQAQHTYYTAHFASARFDIIEQDGQSIGRLYVDRREGEIRVIDIALLPEFRGKGLGGSLMRGLLDEAAAIGQKVSIHVEQFNPARHLYQRLGFVPVHDDGVYRLMEWAPDLQLKTAS